MFKKARMAEWSKAVVLRSTINDAWVRLPLRALFSYIIIKILIMYYFTIASYFQTKPFADCIFPLQHLDM